MKNSGVKLFAALVTIGVIVIVGVGAYLAGSPTQVRNLALDNRRVNDLQSISYAIDQYWRLEKSLPPSLDVMKRTRDVYAGSIVDAETLVPYEYSKTGGMSYELCATFAMPSDTSDQSNGYMAYPVGGDNSNFWTHPAGPFCYALDVRVDTSTVPPPVPPPVK